MVNPIKPALGHKKTPTKKQSDQRLSGAGPGPTDQVSTGIRGLDEVLGGGIPRRCIFMAVGGPGCGKSVLSMELVLRGARDIGEPGVYYSFEEGADDLYANAGSFGWDLESLVQDKRLFVGHFDVRPDQNVESGQFNLDALFLRIEMAIKSVGARRLVLDGINNLLAGFENERIVRMEVMRLFRWLKDKDITVLVTGERGVDSWSKLGFEEYLCDGLMVLENTVAENFTTRHLRIVKCRGVNHGTDNYPFLIGRDGLNIIPVMTADFDYQVADGKYVGTGINELDAMLEPGGFIKGSTVLVTGTSGTGKSSLGAAFASAACERGERAIYFAFEESAEQVIRNMRSIGINLEPWVAQGLLKIHARRATTTGLEGHLVELKNLIAELEPEVAVVDPITAFRPVAPTNQIKLMLIRLNDYLRAQQITTLMTSLSHNDNYDELSDIPMSSLADSWILMRVMSSNNERNNILQILKSRGMAHVKQPRELHFRAEGLRLQELYAGPDGLLAGAARVAQQMRDQEEDELIDTEIQTLKTERKIRQQLLEEKAEAFKQEMAHEDLALKKKLSELEKKKRFRQNRTNEIEQTIRGEANNRGRYRE